MTTIKNENVNVSNLARGLLMTGKGEQAKRQGNALSCVALVMMLKEAQDTPNVEPMLRHMQGVHVNAKQQPETFEAAWNYWKDLLSSAKQVPTFDLKSAKEEEDLSDRREVNTAIGQSVRTLRDACALAFAFHSAHVDWDKVVSVKGDATVIAINQDNALRLFGTKKEKTIAKMHLGIVIDTYGSFSFKALVAEGNARLIAAGTKTAPKRPEEKRTPVRDAVANTRKAIEDADRKALMDDKLVLLELLVTIIDRVNDVDMGDAYIPISVTNAAREAADAKITARHAEIESKLKGMVKAA